MLGLLVFGLVATVGHTAPVGPNYDNIQYLHNFTLTYANNSLDGLGQIDNLTDVNTQMAQSLKSAINLALPGYLSSSRTSSTPSSSASASQMTATSSSSQTASSGSSYTAMPMFQTTTAMQGRKRRAADTTTASSATPASSSSSAPSGSMGALAFNPMSSSLTSSTPSPSGQRQPSTTQPYGTDEEFYARTDLVHFHVDINDLEGSGAV